MAEWTREHVLAAVRHYFPNEDVNTILSLLDEYGVETYERGQERVHVAILRLSGGDADALLEDIWAAKVDYRDVLWWSDTPVDAPKSVEEIWERLIPPPSAFMPPSPSDSG
jgi:hypothetical protein